MSTDQDTPGMEEVLDRIETLEEENEALRKELETQEPPSTQELAAAISDLDVSRRGLLAGGAGVLGAAAMLPGVASAQANENGAACTWRGDQNAAGYGLYGLGELEFEDGTTMTSAASGGGSSLWEETATDGEITPSGSNDSITTAAVDTDDGTFNNSVTYPDGTTVTTSPSRGMEPIETQTPSSASSVDFTTGNGSDYPKYVLSGELNISGSTSRDLWLRVSTDGGSTFKSGASDYAWASQRHRSDGTNQTLNGDGVSEIEVGTLAGSADKKGIEFDITFRSPDDGSEFQRFSFDAVYEIGPGALTRAFGGGHYQTAEAIDAVRLLFDGGDISGGEVTLYGVVN